MAERIIRRAGERVGQEDPEQLAQLVRLRQVVEDAIIRAIAAQRTQGMTWEAIGDCMGVTRQAALMNYGPKITGLERALDSRPSSSGR